MQLQFFEFAMIIVSLSSFSSDASPVVNGKPAPIHRNKLSNRFEQGPEFEGIRECPLGTDDEINECIRQILEDIRPFFTRGIPEVGLPSFEPFRVKDTQMKFWGLELSFRNIAVFGVSKFEEVRILMDSKRKAADVFSAHKHLKMTADYEVDGRLFIAPLRAAGKMEVDLYNYRVNASVFLDILRNRAAGKPPAWIIADLPHRFEDNFDDIRLQLDIPGPLGERNGPLSAFVHKFLNRNLRWLYPTFLRPRVQTAVRNYLAKLDVDLIPQFVPVPTNTSKFQWG